MVLPLGDLWEEAQAVIAGTAERADPDEVRDELAYRRPFRRKRLIDRSPVTRETISVGAQYRSARSSIPAASLATV